MARSHPLMELSVTYFERYWRTGPGSPAALPDLNAGIDALNEAYGYLEVNDPFRGLVAGGLAQQLSARHLAHQSEDRDRKTAIHLFEESLSFPEQPRMAPLIAKVTLAQLLMSRTSKALQSVTADPMRLMREGLPQGNTADLDRAVDLLREVAAAGAVNAELANGAKTLLPMAESMRAMFGALGGGGLDLNRMGQAMGAMQQAMGQAGNFASGFQNAGANPFAAGIPSPGANPFGGMPFGPFGGATSAPAGGGFMPPPILNADALAARAPLDYPVTVVTGSEPPVTEPAVPRRRDAAPVQKCAVMPHAATCLRPCAPRRDRLGTALMRPRS